MHWAEYDFEYIRPIHWIVALLDDEIIPFEILDVKTDRVSRGHRFRRRCDIYACKRIRRKIE